MGKLRSIYTTGEGSEVIHGHDNLVLLLPTFPSPIFRDGKAESLSDVQTLKSSVSLHDQSPSTPDPAFRAHPSLSGLSLPRLCPLPDAQLCRQIAQDCCLAVCGQLGNHFPSSAPGEHLIQLDAHTGRFVWQRLPAVSLEHIRERMPRSGNAPLIGPTCLADGRGLGWGLVGGADRLAPPPVD